MRDILQSTMSSYLTKSSLTEDFSELEIYPKLQALLLANRTITNKEQAEKFLHPDYETEINNPFLIDGMEKAVTRICTALEREEKIVIYTDYDCDGIPAGVILHDFFKKINYKHFSNYIPHRHKEGYGLNIPALEYFKNNGVTLIITADLGITNIAEVAFAQGQGIDVIVSDHHLPHEEIIDGVTVQILPPAYVVLNSKKKIDTYPDNMLCGAAVAWKIVCAVIAHGRKLIAENTLPPHLIFFKEIPDGWEKWLLDMAGLSTIADMVPLRNENRVIATYGLKVLRKSRRPGLQKLLRKTGTNQTMLTEDDIGFTIAPRINAASRMDIPMEGFNMLATTDEVEADRVATHLQNLNDNRKLSVASIMKEIHGELRDRELPPVVVIGNTSWSPGVLGLLANKILETYTRPAFVWGKGDESEYIKGSCRSDGTVNVVDLMLATKEGVFLHVGGHELSGGFSITTENIHSLEKELLHSYEKVKRQDYIPAKNIFIDCVLPFEYVTLENYKLIETLAPFGMDNQKPTFLFENAEIKEWKRFGKEKNHLELIFTDENNRNIKAIGFFMTEKSFEASTGILEVGKQIQLVAQFEKSTFAGRTELRLRIVDIL